MFSQQTLHVRNPFRTTALTALAEGSGAPQTADEFAQFLVNATTPVDSDSVAPGGQNDKRDSISFCVGASEPVPQLSVSRACHQDVVCVTWPHSSRAPMNASVPHVGEAIVVSTTPTARNEKCEGGGRKARCSVYVDCDSGSGSGSGGSVAHAIEQPEMDGVVWISAATISRSSGKSTTVCTLMHPARELHCLFQHPVCSTLPSSDKTNNNNNNKGSRVASDAAAAAAVAVPSSLHIPRGVRLLNEAGRKKDGEATRAVVDSLLSRSIASWIVARLHVVLASARAGGAVPFVSKDEIISRFPYLRLFSNESQLRIIQSALAQAPIGQNHGKAGSPASLVYRGGKVLCLYQAIVSAQLLLSHEERRVTRDIERCLSEVQHRCADRLVEVSRAVHTILHAWNKSSIPSRSSSLRLVVLKYFCVLALCGCLDARTPKWRTSPPVYRAMGLLTLVQAVQCSQCRLAQVVERLNASIGVAAVDIFKDGRKRSAKPEQVAYHIYDTLAAAHCSHQDAVGLSGTADDMVVQDDDMDGSDVGSSGSDGDEYKDGEQEGVQSSPTAAAIENDSGAGDEEDMLQPSSFFASSVHPSLDQAEPPQKTLHLTSYDSLSAGLLQASAGGITQEVQKQNVSARLLEIPRVYGSKHVVSKECAITQFSHASGNARIESAVAVGDCPVCGTLREARRHVNPLCPLYWLRMCVGGDCRLYVSHPCFAEEWVHGGGGSHGTATRAGDELSSPIPVEDEDRLQLTLFANRHPAKKRRAREEDDELLEADLRALTSVRNASRQRDAGVLKGKEDSSMLN